MGHFFSARISFFLSAKHNLQNNIEYESSSDRNQNLSVKKYLNEIKPYLRNTIINLQKFVTWKMHLAIAINFISSKHVEQKTLIHSKSGNIEFILYDNANKVADKLFESILSRY